MFNPLRSIRAASIVLAGVLYVLAAIPVNAAPVELDSGSIEGEALATTDGVRVYRGIPFAAPPV